MASESKRWPLPLHRLSVSKNVFKRLHKEMNREEKRVGLCWNGWSWFCSPFFFVLLIVLTHFLTESSNGVAFLFLEMVWNVVLRSIFVTSECLDVTSLLKGVIHLSVETARNVFLETSFLFFWGGGSFILDRIEDFTNDFPNACSLIGPILSVFFCFKSRSGLPTKPRTASC